MSKTRIKFTQNAKGSINGFEVVDFEAGNTHELPDTLAGAFIEQGVAVEVKVAGGKGEKEPEREIKEINPVKEKKAGK